MTEGRDVRAVRLAHGPLDAVVDDVPGSKSIANRALVCAALATGTSEFTGVPDGDDSQALVTALADLGLGIGTNGSTVLIDGVDGELPGRPAHLDARLAGTTSRFLTALCALSPVPVVVDGAPPLRARPMAPLHHALADLGAAVDALDRPGSLPVRVGGRRPSGGEVALPGDISSQYLTALMLIGPYLAGGLHIRLTTPLVSRPYVELTARVMADFGCSGVAVGDDMVVVGPGRYVGRPYRIEADASSASYPLAAAAVTGGRVTVAGLGSASVQGDRVFADLLARMGCDVRWSTDSITVERTASLCGIEVDMADISDTVPTLAALAAFADSPTTITGVGFIRAKESDRLGDLAGELRRAGIEATELPDGIRIAPSTPHAATFHTHHDHRLAMSLALIGLRTPGIEIADPAVVTKSWPGYWRMLDVLAGESR